MLKCLSLLELDLKKKKKVITGDNVKPGEFEFLLLFPFIHQITAFILLLTPFLALCLLNGPLATQ